MVCLHWNRIKSLIPDDTLDALPHHRPKTRSSGNEEEEYRGGPGCGTETVVGVNGSAEEGEDEFLNDITVLSTEWKVLFATHNHQPNHLANSVVGGINQVYTLQQRGTRTPNPGKEEEGACLFQFVGVAMMLMMMAMDGIL